MNVHVIQHVAFEGPGSIMDWCVANGHALSSTPLFLPGAVLPDADAVDLLVIMGGPMSVYDDDIYPWLAGEKDFIRAFLATERPALGICLGAQLLAVCSGARVGSAHEKEIGWFPVEPTAMAEAFPWLYSLLAGRPMVFHWHGDRFEIPFDGENLASTKANDNQAFVLNDGHVVALQFHPEVTPALLQQMVAEGRHELHGSNFVQTANTIIANAEYRDAGILLRGILDHLEAVASASVQ